MFVTTKKVILAFFMGSMLCVSTPQVEAGMLGDLWDSVVGFFTGKKKPDAQTEQQLTAILQQTNDSQNALIASINEVITYQNQLESLDDPEAKQKLEEMMTTMQQNVQTNQESFMQLMQAKEKLNQAGMGEQYAQNFVPYEQKQQEIESYYPKIEDRYNELAAFSQSSQEEGASTTTEATTQASAEIWKNSDVQRVIDAYLNEKNLDEWGGPKVAGAKVGRPSVAGKRTRYQYLLDSIPGLKAHVMGQVDFGSSEEVVQDEPVQEVVVQDQAPSAPVNSAPSAPSAKPSVGMAFSNNYSNVAIRQERDAVFKQLMDMQKEGKMNSEEYKDLYVEYTKLNDKLKQASR